VGRFQLFDKELTITKVWHDFYTRAQLVFRPGVRSYAVLVEFKFEAMSTRVQERHDWESEWFPERAQGREDRP